MHLGRWFILFNLPHLAFTLSLDQKVSLKLIESLWKDQEFSQAEQEIDRFLKKIGDDECDVSILKMKVDLLIKKKQYADALLIIEKLRDNSSFILERHLLCLYELKKLDQLITLLDSFKSKLSTPFAQKISQLGFAEAIKLEQNIEKKATLIEKAQSYFSSELETSFDASCALALAIIKEEKKEFQEAYALYEKIFDQTKDDSYKLAMAKVAVHFNEQKSLEILEALRWKSGSQGSNAAIFEMQILNDKQDFVRLFEITSEELKIAPEGYRKAKIALFHLKSLFHLKCFNKIPQIFSTYQPHDYLKDQDLQLVISLLCKSWQILEDPASIKTFYSKLKSHPNPQTLIFCGRLLARSYLDKKDFLQASSILEELYVTDQDHHDEYAVTLGLCFLNTNAFEVSEKYLLDVLEKGKSDDLKQKALQHLFTHPKLSRQALSQIIKHASLIDLQTSEKGLYWLSEAYALDNNKEKAIDLLLKYGNKTSALYHQQLGCLKTDQIKESILHFEQGLELTQDVDIKAFLHQKLFISYFDYDIEKAAAHLFKCFNLKPFDVEKRLFDGLISHFYQKAFTGLKIYLKDEDAKLAASYLVRLFSYKQHLEEDEKIILSKTLRKTFKIEEALKVIENCDSIQAHLEKAILYNHLGQYEQADHQFEKIFQEKPYTVYLEGQYALFMQICMHYERFKAHVETHQNAIDKLVRILQICIQDQNSLIGFEVELFKALFLKKDDSCLEKLSKHPFLDVIEHGSHRKILNFLVQNKFDESAVTSLDHLFSEPMEWMIMQTFARVSLK